MTIRARYPGRCGICGERFEAGAKIEWSKGSPACHARCARSAAAEEVAIPAGVQTWQVGRATAPFAVGEAVRTDARMQAAGYPRVCMVLSARQEYIREDGLSMGLPDDEGHWYSATVRAATDEEAAACDARAAEAAARKARIAELGVALRASLIIDGVDAREQRLPQGLTEIWRDARLAGFATWYVAADGVIWYCRSSYADGQSVWQTTATRAMVEEARDLGMRAGI